MTAPTIQHIKAIAFDLDGTLCDSLPDLTAAANATRKHMGLPPLPQSVVTGYIGDGLHSLIVRILSDSKGNQIEPSLKQQGFDFFLCYYKDHLSVYTRPYPETEAGLKLLKSLALPLVLITNKYSALAIALLKQLGLADYFSLILGGDSLSEKKPSPLPLLHTADVLHLNPADIMMVGDSANDILAAKAAGCMSVGVTFGYGNMSLLAQQPATKPDLLINSLPEIYTMLSENTLGK